MDRRGATDTVVLPMFLRILIGILCLIILIYLLYSFTNISKNRTRLEQARATLEELVPKLDALLDGGSGSYLFTAPSGWFFSINPQDVKAKQQCSTGQCLCLCASEGCDGDAACKPTKYGVSLINGEKNSVESVEFESLADIQYIRSDKLIMLEQRQ